jgi:biotin carboxyl carrier protein
MAEIITIKEDQELEGHYQRIGLNEVEFRYHERNYSATISKTNEARTYEVLLNGKNYSIQITNNLDDLISEMGLNVLDVKDAGDIFSPMPGLVLEVMAREGENVIEGQSLVILEAMKMENIIKSTGAGVVKSVSIKNGDKVEKGQLLISIEAAE